MTNLEKLLAEVRELPEMQPEWQYHRARTLLPKLAKIVEMYHQAIEMEADAGGPAKFLLKCAEEIAGG